MYHVYLYTCCMPFLVTGMSNFANWTYVIGQFYKKRCIHLRGKALTLKLT